MKHRQKGKGPFDLIEESVHLLRTAPVMTLAVYYLGAIPFVLGLLFFWADMSRSPFAYQHLADGSLAIAVLFFWMKFWQVIFALNVRAQIVIEAGPALTFQRRAAAVISICRAAAPILRIGSHSSGVAMLPPATWRP